MKIRRLGKMFLLFIVTLGIYRLYWFAKTRKEMMTLGSKPIPSVFYLVIPIIVIVAAVIFLIIGSVNSAIDVRRECGQYSTSPVYQACERAVANDGSAVLPVLVFYGALLLIWPITIWWLWKYCQAVEQVTKNKMSFPISLLITLLVPDGIDILLVQDTFNKLPAAKQA